MYLNLLMNCILDTIHCPKDKLARVLEGRGMSPRGHSMIGWKRLENVKDLIHQILIDEIEGDVIEAGICRGGTVALMRAALDFFSGYDNKKTVWAADSFQGLPEPDLKRFPVDKGFETQVGAMAATKETVLDNLSRYPIDLDGIKFLEGWFKDTLPSAPIEKLALIRADGDLYESTIDILVNLYPKLSPGGFIIIDDYGCYKACRQAVQDYRKQHKIEDEIIKVDWTGVYWRKS